MLSIPVKTDRVVPGEEAENCHDLVEVSVLARDKLIRTGARLTVFQKNSTAILDKTKACHA